MLIFYSFYIKYPHLKFYPMTKTHFHYMHRETFSVKYYILYSFIMDYGSELCIDGRSKLGASKKCGSKCHARKLDTYCKKWISEKAFQCDCFWNKYEKLGHRSYFVYIFNDKKLQESKALFNTFTRFSNM